MRPSIMHEVMDIWLMLLPRAVGAGGGPELIADLPLCCSTVHKYSILIKNM